MISSPNKVTKDPHIINNSLFCPKHIHNKLYMLCLTCNDKICDKCFYERHSSHKIEQVTKYIQSNKALLSLLQTFKHKFEKDASYIIKAFDKPIAENNISSTLRTSNEINQQHDAINSFFKAEQKHIEEITDTLIESITQLASTAKSLMNLIKVKFDEIFSTLREQYDKMMSSLNEKSNKDTSNISDNRDALEQFLKAKFSMENDMEVLNNLLKLSKGSIISEFSLKDLYFNMKIVNTFIMEQCKDYQCKKDTSDINAIINNIKGFDEEKMFLTGRNILPINSSNIFQQIDTSSNLLNIYNAENEFFTQISLLPETRPGFYFFPFSRSINFCGCLFVTGGYELLKTTNVVWAIVESDLFSTITTSSSSSSSPPLDNNKNDYNEEANNRQDKGLKKSKFITTYQNFLKNIPMANKALDTKNNIKVIQCANMHHCRAGHTIVGLAPNLLIIIGGIDNNKSCEIYHVNNNRWEEISSMKKGRSDSSAFIINNYVYVFGGLFFEIQDMKITYCDEIERLSLIDPYNTEWEQVFYKVNTNGIHRQMICARSNAGIIIKNENSILIIGGQKGDDDYLDDVLEFNASLKILAMTTIILPKPCAFLERGFAYLHNTALSFDFSGDVLVYDEKRNKFNLIFHSMTI